VIAVGVGGLNYQIIYRATNFPLLSKEGIKGWFKQVEFIFHVILEEEILSNHPRPLLSKEGILRIDLRVPSAPAVNIIMLKSKTSVMYPFLKAVLLVAIVALLSCSSEDQGSQTESAGLVRSGEVVINNSVDQPESIVKGIYGPKGDSLVYGMDLRRKLPYQLNLANGDFRFLGASGRGPQEMELP